MLRKNANDECIISDMIFTGLLPAGALHRLLNSDKVLLFGYVFGYIGTDMVIHTDMVIQTVTKKPLCKHFRHHWPYYLHYFQLHYWLHFRLHYQTVTYRSFYHHYRHHSLTRFPTRNSRLPFRPQYARTLPTNDQRSSQRKTYDDNYDHTTSDTPDKYLHRQLPLDLWLNLISHLVTSDLG